MRVYCLTIFLLLVFQSLVAQVDFNSVSEQLLTAVIENQPTQDYQDILTDASIEELQINLDTDTKRLF